MTIKIDKNIPPPSQTRHALQIYPWDEMKVGDSFFVNTGHYPTISNPNKRLKPKRFSLRKEGDGYRIWRIK